MEEADSALLAVEVPLEEATEAVEGSAVEVEAAVSAGAGVQGVAASAEVPRVRDSHVAVAGADLEVVDVEATKRMHSHVDTPKSAKHEGVNRQRRHGVMRPWTAWEMVRKEALFRKEAVHLMFYAVQDYFEIQRRGAKKPFQLHSFRLYQELLKHW